jgi:hypothetical protein
MAPAFLIRTSLRSQGFFLLVLMAADAAAAGMSISAGRPRACVKSRAGRLVWLISAGSSLVESQLTPQAPSEHVGSRQQKGRSRQHQQIG